MDFDPGFGKIKLSISCLGLKNVKIKQGGVF